MLDYIELVHSKHKDAATWSTYGQKSGKMGTVWYCDKCDYMMVFHKDIIPPTKPQSGSKGDKV